MLLLKKCICLYLSSFTPGIQKSGMLQEVGRFAQTVYKWMEAASLDLKTCRVGEQTIVRPSEFQSHMQLWFH